MKLMGRPNSLRKGSWNEEEDQLLKKYVEKYGEGNWKHIPTKAGLNRCRKSCRLRWLNYLRPNIKRGDFAVDEDDLIIRLHGLLGNRWSLIAGRIPGRTANDIKNYWNSYLSKKINNGAAAAVRKNTRSLENHNCTNDNSAMNWEEPSSEGDFLESSSNPKIGEGELDDEEQQDMTSFWRSLLLEGDYMETKLAVENKERKQQQQQLQVQDNHDYFFQGLGDLLQDVEILGGSTGQ